MSFYGKYSTEWPLENTDVHENFKSIHCIHLNDSEVEYLSKSGAMSFFIHLQREILEMFFLQIINHITEIRAFEPTAKFQQIFWKIYEF